MVARSVALFALAALAEIGGAYLVWIGLREGRGAWVAVLGGIALAAYGVIATLQPANEVRAGARGLRRRVHRRLSVLGHGLGRVPPDRFDLTGAALALAGVAVIMYASR